MQLALHIRFPAKELQISGPINSICECFSILSFVCITRASFPILPLLRFPATYSIRFSVISLHFLQLPLGTNIHRFLRLQFSDMGLNQTMRRCIFFWTGPVRLAIKAPILSAILMLKVTRRWHYKYVKHLSISLKVSSWPYSRFSHI